jgi:hypothetical protein
MAREKRSRGESGGEEFERAGLIWGELWERYKGREEGMRRAVYLEFREKDYRGAAAITGELLDRGENQEILEKRLRRLEKKL